MKTLSVTFEFDTIIDFFEELFSFQENNIKYPNQNKFTIEYSDFSSKQYNELDVFNKNNLSDKLKISMIEINLNTNSRIFLYPKELKSVGAYFENIVEIEDFYNYFNIQNMKFGHLNNESDLVLSRESDISYWQYKNTPIPPYAKLIPKFDFDDKNAKQIDLESLPGHTHSMGYDEGLWFGACYQMYFSEIYYKYIPKSLFDAFTDCFENVVLENGVRKITLYENPDDYDLPDSRRRQFEFRKQLGIDTIGHELTMPVDLFIDDNLPVYITKKNIAEGQTKVIRYLDATKNLVIKKKASFKETKIYLEDGVTVVFEKLEKKNFFGNFV